MAAQRPRTKQKPRRKSPAKTKPAQRGGRKTGIASEPGAATGGKTGVKVTAKTRSRKNPLDRKQELIQATIDVLAAKGYAAFTLAEVAAIAGVSTALIIVHFKSKERLLLDVLRTMGQDYFGALHASQIGKGERPVDLLWHLVQAEFDMSFFTPRYLAAWKTFWAETNGRKQHAQIFGAQSRHFLNLTTDLCRRIIADGGYEDHDPQIVARLIDSSLSGLWNDLTVTGTPVTVQEARRIATGQLALFFPRHFTSQGPR